MEAYQIAGWAFSLLGVLFATLLLFYLLLCVFGDRLGIATQGYGFEEHFLDKITESKAVAWVMFALIALIGLSALAQGILYAISII